MTDPRSELDRVHIPSPCTADWSAMEGDERSRYCSECSLHVHNLAAHTREEADELLARRHGGERVCVRLELDADGRPLTVEDRRPGRAREAALALALGASLLAACRDTSDKAAVVEPGTPGGACETELLGDVVLGEPVDEAALLEAEAREPSAEELLGRVAPGAPVGTPPEGEPIPEAVLQRLERLGYVADAPEGEPVAPGQEAPAAAEEGACETPAGGEAAPARKVLMGTPGPAGPGPAPQGPGKPAEPR